MRDAGPAPDLTPGPMARTPTTQKNLSAGEKEKSGAQWVNRFPTSRLVADLHAVGQTYGVIKLISDPPHWSDNGR